MITVNIVRTIETEIGTVWVTAENVGYFRCHHGKGDDDFFYEHFTQEQIYTYQMQEVEFGLGLDQLIICCCYPQTAMETWNVVCPDLADDMLQVFFVKSKSQLCIRTWSEQKQLWKNEAARQGRDWKYTD